MAIFGFIVVSLICITMLVGLTLLFFLDGAIGRRKVPVLALVFIAALIGYLWKVTYEISPFTIVMTGS